MATKYFCDRCDRSFDSKSDSLATISVPNVPPYNRMDLSDISSRSYDLCEQCLRAINEALKPLPVNDNR
jgi:hypothetical protein